MSVSWPALQLILLGTFVIAVLAVRETAAGWDQRRELAARSALDEAERRATTPMARADARLRRTDLGRHVGRRIAAAGLRIRVSTFLFLIALAGGTAVLGVGRFFAPLFGAGAAVGVALLAFAYLRRREERRKEEFIAQLPELARVLSNATSAGLALRTAVAMAATELNEPAKSELGRVSDALRLGQPLEQALRDLSERLPSRELSVLISTLVVASRSGGSLVTALRSIAGTLEGRKEVRREIRTIMGEAVVTNWSIGALGIGALVMIRTLQPDALRQMSSELIGQIILGGAACGFVLSVLIVRRLTRIDV